MEQKTTFRKALQFEGHANEYLKKNPKERSAFTLALEKILGRESFKRALADFRYELQEEVEKLRGDFREKDKDGNFKERIIGEGTANASILPVFKPGEEDKFKKKVKDMETERLDEADAFTFKPYLVPAPKTLEFRYIEPLTGFVLDPMNEEQLDQFYLAQEVK